MSLKPKTKNKHKKSSDTIYQRQKTTAATSLFPQIYRRINASFKIAIIISLSILILINFFASFSQFTILNNLFMQNVRSPVVHLILADKLASNNNFIQAEQVLLSGLDFVPDNLLLSERLREIRLLKQKPEDLRREISYWEEIIKEKPKYRDGYFQLAILNYQLYQDKKTSQYLHKVLEIDPNFKPAKNFSRYLN